MNDVIFVFYVACISHFQKSLFWWAMLNVWVLLFKCFSENVSFGRDTFNVLIFLRLYSGIQIEKHKI